MFRSTDIPHLAYLAISQWVQGRFCSKTVVNSAAVCNGLLAYACTCFCFLVLNCFIVWSVYPFWNCWAGF